MPSTTPDFSTVTAGGSPVGAGGGAAAVPVFDSAGVADRRLERRCGGISPPLARSGLGQVFSKFAAGISPASGTGGAAGGCAGSPDGGSRSRSLRRLEENRRFRFGLGGGEGSGGASGRPRGSSCQGGGATGDAVEGSTWPVGGA